MDLIELMPELPKSHMRPYAGVLAKILGERYHAFPKDTVVKVIEERPYNVFACENVCPFNYDDSFYIDHMVQEIDEKDLAIIW